MCVLLLIKADKDSEAGVMLAGEGLNPGAKGLRMRFSGAERMRGRRRLEPPPAGDARGEPRLTGFAGTRSDQAGAG